jgi:hypothetical protein
VGTTEIKRLLTLILVVHLLAKNLKSGQKHGFSPLKFYLPILPVSNGNGIPSFKVLTPYYPYIPLYPLCTPFIPRHTHSYPVIPSIIATYRVYCPYGGNFPVSITPGSVSIGNFHDRMERNGIGR